MSVAQSQNSEAIEEVVVTGSRMRGVEAPVGSPVIDLDRDYIANSAAISVDQMIKELPQVFDLGVSEASRGQSGGNGNIVWANSVNLRGIGPYATLVLVDGHRVNSNARSIDPSILPSLALERVEVLADGSSAVYGSDAVAGVVNLITRREVDGAEVVARRGVGSDYDEYKVGASWGTTWDSGSVFLAAEKGLRDRLNGMDRDYFRAYQSATADYRVNRCAPGNIVVNGTSYAIPEEGVTPATAGNLDAGTVNRCESLAHQDLLPRQEYDNFAFTSTFDLTQSLSLYVDGYWSERDFSRNPDFMDGNLTVPSSNAFFVDPSGAGATETTVQYSFIDDLPQDEQTGFQRNWELTTGFKLNLPADWLLEGLVTYGDLHERSESLRGINSRALDTALASSDPATAFDPYGLNRSSPEVIAAISNQIFIADTYNELLAYELRADGGLFELPGGMVRLAVGLESQEQTNEPGVQRGSPGVAMRRPTYERDVDSYYGEVLIPIVGADNALPGVQSLEVNVAARTDDYSDVGSTSNPKYGVNWSPVDDLTVRASYGTSFRAPLFSQLYGNSSALFVQPYSDPTQGGAVVPGVALSGGNLELEPEEATTWSVGFDYRPEAVPGLGVSLTWFNVEYEGQIETYLADLSVLSREDDFQGTGIILRDAEAEAMVQSLLADGLGYARGVPPSPVALFVDGRTNNLGRSETTGLDFAIDYLWSMGDWGEMIARFGGMYIDSYEVSITPTGAMEDLRNTIFNPLTFKSRTSLDWNLGPYMARLVWNHVNGYENDRASNPETVSAFNTFDLRGGLTLGDPEGEGWTDGLMLGLDVMNLLDEEPPYVNIAPGVNGGGGYDPTAATPVGRVVALSLRKKF
ncbi:TonB-dependent receptor plug domain-containing protein [Gilvimarinus sp. F26214L]|uniref:TonB-dependent receptor plug domain-containing protein n=1 Tax=Gilvimarinus sp. DZF01 TaxID=3461371 RepID=UPI00404679E6